MKNTEEQLAVVQSEANLLKVNAFAGTGKTSTLVSYSEARPNERMLYIAFNKPVQLEAERRFPKNVHCKTSHGLAFGRFGGKYADNGKLVDKLRVNGIIEALEMSHLPDAFGMYVADAAIKTLTRFLCSDRDALDESLTNGLILPDMGVHAGDIAACATRLWDKMIDPSDKSVGMVHDGYLKLFQLSNPTLKYDRILFDEFQDANAVTAAIVEAQRCPRVVVGDEHQAIYAFRGAINALASFDAEETLAITKSFRFGQPVADVANLLLSTYKGESRRIVGTASPGRLGKVDHNKPYAVISRSNASLFEEASRHLNNDRRIHFVGGIGGYRIGDVMDVFSLWRGNKDSMQNPHLRAFRDFDSAEQYAELSGDREIKSLIGIVQRHANRIPNLVARIKAKNTETPQEAQVHLTTAHKSKGLEWDQVKLTDDYMTLLSDKGVPRKLDPDQIEDVNILYVAATRAKRVLEPYEEMQALINQRIPKARQNTFTPTPAATAREKRLPDWAQPIPPNGLVPRKKVR